MKKYIALFLAAMMAFGTAGCGGKGEEQQAVTAEAGTEAADENTEGQTAEAKGEAAAEGENAEGTPEAEGETAETTPDAAGEAAPEAVSEKFALHPAYVLAEGAPNVAAGAAILIEESTGTILFEKNADQKMYPASMTKVLTALVAMDHFKGDEVVTVGTEINEVSLDSSKAGHQLGEKLTMENLIRGLIIPSGNDSANVIAAAVARRTENNENLNFGQCQVIFTDLMNKKAEELGATGSHFANAHGYHDENHYTTAKDMALFSKAFMENPTLEAIANEKSFAGNGANGLFAEDPTVKTQDYAWRSHNLLITDGEFNYPYASGIKTGFTNEAGDCLTAAAKKDNENLIAVVFNAADPNRWLDSKNMFEYGFNGYDETVLAKANEAIEEMPLTKHKKKEGDTLAVVHQQDYATFLPAAAADAVKVSVEYNDTYAEQDKEGNTVLRAPIAKGAEVGTATYTIDGKKVLEAPVYAGRDVAKGSVFSMIGYFFQNLFSNIFSLKGLMVLGGIVAVAVIGFIVLKMVSGRRYKSRGSYSFGRSSGIGGKRRRRRGGRRRF